MASSVNFDRIADRYDETRGGEARGRAVADALLRHLGPDPVVEVGVGTGLVAAPLQASGRTVLGFDLSDAMLRRAAPRLPGRIGRADAERLPVADAVVGSCVAVHVLHLVARPGAVLNEVARVLVADGRFVVVDLIGDASPADDIDGIVEPLFLKLRHRRMRRNAPDELRRFGRAAGLALVDELLVDSATAGRTPEQAARSVEQRVWSALWALPQQTWDELVRPAIDDLRALPDQDRPRRHLEHWRLLVFARTGSNAGWSTAPPVRLGSASETSSLGDADRP